VRRSFRQGISRIPFSAFPFRSSLLVRVAASCVRMSCFITVPSTSNNRDPAAPVPDGLSKRSLVRSHPTAAVSCYLSPRRTFFPRLPLTSSYGLLLPQFRHQKEVSVVSTEEITLIGRISDVVWPGRGSDFVA